ncbi:MAG: DinB family protein [Blastocatellia bacterium]
MPPSVSASDHLHRILDEIQQINSDAEKLVAGLTEDQLNWIPAPGAWSINLCLEHLRVSNEQMRPMLEGAMSRAKQRAANSEKPYKPTMIGGWMINTMRQTDGKRKFRAPKNFQPQPDPPPGGLPRFLQSQRMLASLVERAQGLDLSVTLRSPVTALMRYNLGDAYEIAAAHARRHVAQAGRVKAQMPK